MPDNGQLRFGYGTIAAAGSTQAGATQIVNQITYVTAADGTKGVALPSMVKGMTVMVLNGSATAALKVYPFVGDSAVINALSADAAYTVPPGTYTHFIGSSKTQIYVNDSLNAGVTAGTVTASKAVVVDSNKDIGTFRYVRGTNFITQRGQAVSDSTAGAITITAAMILAGKLVRDPNGSARTDTFDTGANLVAALPGAAVGDELRLKIMNNADAAETLTLAVPASGSFAATQKTHTIVQNASLEVIIRITNVTASSEAYVVHD
jgi:hypothetical protein